MSPISLYRPSSVARTIATMPARTASGSASQRSSSSARSGDFWLRNAKQDAKTPGSFAEVLSVSGVAGVRLWPSKPVGAVNNALGRFDSDTLPYLFF